MSGLPQGWAAAEFEQIADIKLGKMLDKTKNRGEPTRYLRNVNVRWGAFELDDISYMPMSFDERAALRIGDGDILVCEGGEPGRSAVWDSGPTDLAYQKALMRVRPRGGIEPRLLTAFLRWSYDSGELERHFTGTTIKHLPQSALSRLPLPLPPLPEQRRIVAKIEGLTGKSRRAREQLDRIPRLVEKYRQAVLAAAFRGDLTRDWRASNADQLHGPNVQSSFDLDDSERGVWPSDVLPQAWEWRRFDGFFVDLTDSGRKLPQKEYLPEGPYPVVDQGAAKVGGYTDRAALLHPAAPPFIVFGDHTRCVKYIEQRFVQGADGVKVFQATSNVLPTFACLALSAVALPDKGYSRHMKFVRSTLFPVPPPSEQVEIVRIVGTVFDWIDRLASDATSARRLIDRLDQAVLAKAFRGELVPQDTADEPATTLLERIRAERGAAPKAQRGRKPRTAP